MDRMEIEQCIPHRTPFLWIDEIVEIAQDRVRARKYIDPELDLFRGHYPGFPVLPGVLQCEAVFQAAAVLIAHSGVIADGKVPVVTRQNNTKFRHMVRPGDTLDIEVQLKERLANAFYFDGKVSVNGKTTVQLEFACAAADAPAITLDTPATTPVAAATAPDK